MKIQKFRGTPRDEVKLLFAEIVDHEIDGK